jgi:hypothetical protein
MNVFVYDIANSSSANVWQRFDFKLLGEFLKVDSIGDGKATEKNSSNLLQLEGKALGVRAGPLKHLLFRRYHFCRGNNEREILSVKRLLLLDFDCLCSFRPCRSNHPEDDDLFRIQSCDPAQMTLFMSEVRAFRHQIKHRSRLNTN